MKKNKYLFVLCMLLAITLAGGIFTRAYIELEEHDGGQDTLRVVTSFYPVYIAALNVVGDSEQVTLENLSEPQTGCMHDYQLTPQDMILLSQADVFIVNGGGIESFLADVGKAYPDLKIVEATQGLALIGGHEEEDSHEDKHEEEDSHEDKHEEEDSHEDEHEEEDSHEDEHEEEHNHEDGHDHGYENAHGWMDTELYAKMVQNIADALSNADEEHADAYQEHARAYCEKINDLTVQIAELRAAFTHTEDIAEDAAGTGSTKGRQVNVVIFHEAYEYVAEQYGLNVTYCLDLDEERQVSAGEVADVMEEIAHNHVSVILAEEQYGKDMGNTVEAETDCKVYYLDSLVRGDYTADSYLTAMQKNIDIMRRILDR